MDGMDGYFHHYMKGLTATFFHVTVECNCGQIFINPIGMTESIGDFIDHLMSYIDSGDRRLVKYGQAINEG